MKSMFVTDSSNLVKSVADSDFFFSQDVSITYASNINKYIALVRITFVSFCLRKGQCSLPSHKNRQISPMIILLFPSTLI